MVQTSIERKHFKFIRLKPTDAVPFYEKNGFRFMNIKDNDPHTRLMYYDLMDIAN